MYNAIIRDKLIAEFGLEATIKYAKMEAFRYKYRAEHLQQSIFIGTDECKESVGTAIYEAEWWLSEAKYMEKQLNNRHNEHKTGISEGLRAPEGMDEA